MRKYLVIIFAIIALIAMVSISMHFLRTVTMVVFRPDTDVTSSPEYNFSSFAGTVWKTKTRMALADLKQYTGKHDLRLLVPKYFDPTHPDYTPAHDMQIITVLPVGTRLRIERLMQNNGNWGGVYVTATLLDAANPQKTVYLDAMLLESNRFASKGPTTSTNWGVEPEFLEK
ncbi:MAG: hypothetical protein JWR19_475 [Pedosphaera sp.]|nr:hypothetical protein [Pedosphaera sp.]